MNNLVSAVWFLAAVIQQLFASWYTSRNRLAEISIACLHVLNLVTLKLGLEVSTLAAESSLTTCASVAEGLDYLS